MEEKILTIGVLLIGWLLGLISPRITKYISEKRERTDLKKIIINDLTEVKKKTSPIIF